MKNGVFKMKALSFRRMLGCCFLGKCKPMQIISRAEAIEAIIRRELGAAGQNWALSQFEETVP